MKKFIFVLFLCLSLLYSGCKWKDIFAPKNDNSESVSILSTEIELTTLTNVVLTNVVLTNVVDKSFMTNNLIGEWLFFTNFRDSSVNSNHGVPFGYATILKNCGRNEAPACLLIQDGMPFNYSKVIIPSKSSLDFIDDFSLVIWVELNIYVRKGGYILSRKSETNSNEGWSLSCNLTNCFKWNSTIIDVGSSFFEEFSWTFITITYEKDMNTLKIYINKDLKSAEILTNTFYNTGTGCDLLLGVEYSSSTNCLDCNISEFRLFNKALTTNEMNYLYGL